MATQIFIFDSGQEKKLVIKLSWYVIKYKRSLI